MSVTRGCRHEGLQIDTGGGGCRQPAAQTRYSYRSCARERTSPGAGGQHVIPPSPAAPQLPGPQGAPSEIAGASPGASQLRAGPWKPKPPCYFANLYCFLIFWKMCTGLTCSSPIMLDLLQTVLLWGMKEYIYLAVKAIWVATAKQSNCAASKGRGLQTMLF